MCLCCCVLGVVFNVLEFFCCFGVGVVFDAGLIVVLFWVLFLLLCCLMVLFWSAVDVLFC